MEHRLFKGIDATIKLHVFSEDESEIDRMIRFRNHLWKNKEDRGKYESRKGELAEQKWEHVQHYADAKTEVIAEIMGIVEQDK